MKRGWFGVAAMLVAACTGSGAPPPAGSPAPTPIPPFTGPTIELTVVGEAFSESTLQAPANARFRILLDNQDAYAHAVAIAVGETAADARQAEPIYEGKFWSGPGLQAYDIPAMVPGQYWFFCQPHASMNGTLIVE